MRALVITEFPPLTRDFKARGNYRRFRLFMDVIREIVDEIDILHLWPGDDLDVRKLNSEQSEHLGIPVSTYLVERQARRRTFANAHLLGICSVYAQDEFFASSGGKQAAKVAELLGRSPDLVFVHRLPAPHFNAPGYSFRVSTSPYVL